MAGRSRTRLWPTARRGTEPLPTTAPTTIETVTATDENLKWALDLEAARLVNVKINKQLLDVEMTVVRNEFERGENSPQRVLSERVASTAFLWHNYGKSTIGSREDIEKVPAERLAAFYKKYYQPDNAVLAIGGKIDEAKTLQWVAETLGRIPRPTRKLDQTYTVEPTQDGMRYVELRRVGEGQEVIMAYHAPAAAHPGCGGTAGAGRRDERRRRRARRTRRRWRRHRTAHQGAGGQQEGGERQHARGAAARSRPAAGLRHA